jgi:hypothetical protein
MRPDQAAKAIVGDQKTFNRNLRISILDEEVA